MGSKNIAVVVPSIRESSLEEFRKSWAHLFLLHEVELIVVHDGKTPILEHLGRSFTLKEIMGRDHDLIYNFNDGVRNLGFAYVAKELPTTDYILTLDDDTKPLGDTIQDHLDALDRNVPVSWMSTANEYMRGFPYKVRDEAEVVLSHGVWEGVADWDASTQLAYGNRPIIPYKGIIPKGVFYPMCIMNVMIKKKLLPYFYQAPAYKQYQRFSDIWCGLNSKVVIDRNGWAVVSGYATVKHERASDVFVNLKKEAHCMWLNEDYYTGNVDHFNQEDKEYLSNYHHNMTRWEKFIKSYERK